jgi:hypothetical protein
MRTFHGHPVKIILKDGQVIEGRFDGSSGGKGKVTLQGGLKIPNGKIKKFITYQRRVGV